MNARTLIPALLLCAACLWGGRAAAQKPASLPVLAITDAVLQHGGADTIRMGRLHAGEKGVKRFVLRNDTQKPLVIITTETSCHCTSFDYTRRPILAGGETTVTCTFDSSGEWGWQFKLIKFILSGAKEPLRIYVEAEVD